MMKRLLIALYAALALAGAAQASEGGYPLDRFPHEKMQDVAALQNGARLFVNYCLNCHSAQYMRYNRMRDIGLSEAQIKQNLLFTGQKVGETMKVALDPQQAKSWFGGTPPDLSVIARSRAGAGGSGADYLYTYLRTFYRDDTCPTGWNNLVFPNVGMPNVLWQLSGVNKLVQTEYDDHEKATAAAIAIKGLSAVEPLQGHKYAVLQSVADVPGSMTRVQYEAFVADLVNYLDYMAEPVKNRRIHLGILVLLFLGVLFVFAYALKREYWKDLH